MTPGRRDVLKIQQNSTDLQKTSRKQTDRVANRLDARCFDGRRKTTGALSTAEVQPRNEENPSLRRPTISARIRCENEA